MKIRISRRGWLYNNSLLFWAPYLLGMIVLNLPLAWLLLDLTGLGLVPSIFFDTGRPVHEWPTPGRWIALPAGGLFFVEHLLLTVLVDVEVVE